MEGDQFGADEKEASEFASGGISRLIAGQSQLVLSVFQYIQLTPGYLWLPFCSVHQGYIDHVAQPPRLRMVSHVRKLSLQKGAEGAYDKGKSKADIR